MAKVIDKRTTSQLMDWYKGNKRPLAWRNSHDPYRIWLSEIIMQQTRIEQGTPYYLKFVRLFPTVFDLAKAQEDEILKAWQGLGYYSRARNMLKTARIIVEQNNGVFPVNYKDLTSLPGIGDYTASVILSVCFGYPYPVVDGNVTRVISRWANLREPVNSPGSKKDVKAIVNQLLADDHPGDVNEALMDLGAQICLPASYACTSCPLSKDCYARMNHCQPDLPVKAEVKKLKKRYFHYFLIANKDSIFMQRRDENDIWAGLYELPLKEADHARYGLDEIIKIFGNGNRITQLETKRHLLTHRELIIKFYLVETGKVFNKKLMNKFPASKQILIGELKNLAVPRPIELFIEKMDLC